MNFEPDPDERTPSARLDAEARLRLALDAGAVTGVWFWDVPRDVFTADELFARSFGLEADALSHGVPLARVVQSIHPDDEPRVQGLIGDALTKGGPYCAEYRVLRGGEYRWIEANGRVDLDGSGAASRFPGVLIDIDRRKRAELRQTALLALGDTLRQPLAVDAIAAAAGGAVGVTMEASRAGFGLVDPVARSVNIYDDWRASSDVASIRGMHRFEDFGSYLQDLLRGETVSISDVRLDPRTRDHADAWEALGARAVLNTPLMAAGTLQGVAFAHSDKPRTWSDEDAAHCRAVADRAWAALETRDSEHRLRELDADVSSEVQRRLAARDLMWSMSKDLMLVAAFDGTIEAVNGAWTQILGWSESELVGGNFLDLVHPDDRERTTLAAGDLSRGGSKPRFDNRYRAKDGSTRWISWGAAPGRGLIVAVGRDVTSEKETAESLALAEEQLRQAQKMEAVGQLTGGLAHDFNNMLSSINLSLELLRRRAGQADPEEVHAHVGRGAKAVRGAAALIQRLLAFSRKQSLDYRAVDVDSLLSGMVDLLRRTLGERMEISTAPGADGWLARADANQVETALMNLAINARDAMPERGALTLGTRRLSLPAGVARPRGVELPDGDYLAIWVADTGTGMPPEVVARAFEPFFTTKGIGEGTGLGLSMIHGFAKQSGGDASIDSAVGRGTTVTIYLPRALDGEKYEDRQRSDAAAPMGRGERVLLVEDEPDVRAATAEALLRMGYSPRIARDAESALAILRESIEIDALVTDVGLPGMDGRELARLALKERPEIKVLFVTGYAAKAEARPEFLGEAMDMLPKPYALDELADKLARLLGR